MRTWRVCVAHHKPPSSLLNNTLISYHHHYSAMSSICYKHIFGGVVIVHIMPCRTWRGVAMSGKNASAKNAIIALAPYRNPRQLGNRPIFYAVRAAPWRARARASSSSILLPMRSDILLFKCLSPL